MGWDSSCVLYYCCQLSFLQFRLAELNFCHRGKMRFYGKRSFLKPLDKQMMKYFSLFFIFKISVPNAKTNVFAVIHFISAFFAFCRRTFGPSEALAEQCTFRLSLSPSRVFARRTCRRYIEKWKVHAWHTKNWQFSNYDNLNLESISTDNIKLKNQFC